MKGSLPASITLELENSTSEISQLDIIASPLGIHWKHRPNKFMFEFLKDGTWMWPNWLDIVGRNLGYFDQSTGEIEVDTAVFNTVINFDPIPDVT